MHLTRKISAASFALLDCGFQQHSCHEREHRSVLALVLRMTQCGHVPNRGDTVGLRNKSCTAAYRESGLRLDGNLERAGFTACGKMARSAARSVGGAGFPASPCVVFKGLRRG